MFRKYTTSLDFILDQAWFLSGTKGSAKMEPKYNSTRAEKVLVSKFFDTIGHFFNRKKGTRKDASIEAIISKIIAERASNKGYSGFSPKSFIQALKRGNNKFSRTFLEKYEFLFKFSKIFSESESDALIEAIQEYRKKSGEIFGSDKGRESVEKFLRQEYDLIKAIQIAYFKEQHKYVSIITLGNMIKASLHDHFFGHPSGRFETPIIFKIEMWSKKNLGRNFSKIQYLILEWRIDNDDNSVYADQSTHLRKIAYDILVLYAQVYDKIINIRTLDNLLKKRFSEDMPGQFFGNKFKTEYESLDSLAEEKGMDLLKIFVEENFMQKASKGARQLIDDINDYNKLPRHTHLKYSGNYINLSPYLLNNLIYITKGMNPLYCNFYEDEELSATHKDFKSGLIKVVPHHINEDPSWDFIYHIFHDGNEYSYRFALAPLSFSFNQSVRAANNDLHDRNFPQGAGNNLVEARMRHLLELDRISYDKSFTKQEAIEHYYPIFKEIFKAKKDYIFQYGKDVNIWSEFENGQIPGIIDKNIMTYTKKWVGSKIMPENTWFNNHYKRFYHIKYVPFIENVKKYCKENLEWGRYAPFYEWFLNEYLPNDFPP